MCDTDTINIGIVDRLKRTLEAIWRSNLVASDPPAHLVILFTTSGVGDPITAASGRISPTHPVWGGVLPPHRRTLLGGVRHVEVDYTSPAS